MRAYRAKTAQRPPFLDASALSLAVPSFLRDADTFSERGTSDATQIRFPKEARFGPFSSVRARSDATQIRFPKEPRSLAICLVVTIFGLPSALSECLLAALTGSAGEFTNFEFPAKKFVFDWTRSFCPFFLPVLFACSFCLCLGGVEVFAEVFLSTLKKPRRKKKPQKNSVLQKTSTEKDSNPRF